MKLTKRMRLVIVVAVAIVLLSLILINRDLSQSAEQLYSSGAVAIQQGNSSQLVLKADQLTKLSSETFKEKFQRQVGEPIDREYTGVALPTLLEQAGVVLEENDKVSIMARDNYAVELTATEAMSEGNVYIVTQQDGQLLDEKSGRYMLIIRHDERATRWVKQVAVINVLKAD